MGRARGLIGESRRGARPKPPGLGRPEGAGGGKKKKPKQTKESGASTAYARLLGVLTYGPAEGVIGGLNGVYLDETPVESSGTRNFDGVVFDQRFGLKNQTPMSGFGDSVSSETNVGVEVKNGVPITRSFTNSNINILRVRLGFQLQEFPDDGGYRALSIEFRILIRQGLGPFVEVLRRSMKERFASLVEMEYEFPITGASAGGAASQFQVRVERITPQDSNTTRYQRTMTFRAFGETIVSGLIYPYLAMVGLQFESSQFSTLPQISFLAGGRLILIPSNAVVAADRGLDYTGTWNGQFIEAPIAPSDPAWIFYDMCVNDLYGFGRYIRSGAMDKWSFYSLSKYCNELLLIGQSGDGAYASPIYERRYRFNAVINSQEDAWRLLEGVRSMFNGSLFWYSGTAVIEADRPTPTTAIVSAADVVDGSFSYVSSQLRAINTVAHVAWVNPDDFYRQEIEPVIDHVGLKRYGRNVLRTSAFGCTSRTQAHRLGWAYLVSDRLERETVRFRIRGKGMYFRPSQVIEIMDVVESVLRYSGLVISATQNQISLDRPVVIQAGSQHRVTVAMPDGTIARSFVMNAPGSHTVLVLQHPTPMAAAEGATWHLSNATIGPGSFRIISILPVAEDDPLTLEITAIQYADEKYNIIDTDYYVPPAPPRQAPPPNPDPPTDIIGRLDLSSLGGLLSASWTKPANTDYIVGYTSRYRIADGEWSDPPSDSTHTSISWDVFIDGDYEIEVASVDINGKTSGWVPALIEGPVNISTDFDSQYTMV
jgi:predicted phage tail protein